MLRIGVIPMPLVRNTAGLVTSLCKVNDPLAAHGELRAKSGCFQRVLKGSLTHAHCDHDRPFVVRRACEREDPGIVAFTLHGRVREDNVRMLPSSELGACTLCAEPEGHRISSDARATPQRR